MGVFRQRLASHLLWTLSLGFLNEQGIGPSVLNGLLPVLGFKSSVTEYLSTSQRGKGSVDLHWENILLSKSPHLINLDLDLKTTSLSHPDSILLSRE